MKITAPARIAFDTAALPRRDRFPVFCEEIVRRYTGLELRTTQQAEFRAALDLRQMDVITIGRTVNSALDAARTSQFVRDGDDGLCVMLLQSGVAYYRTPRGDEYDLRSGDAIVCDYSQPGQYSFVGDADSWSIKIPRHHISNLMPLSTRLAGATLDKDCAARTLLFSYLQATLDIQFDPGAPETRFYQDHITDLIALALGAEGGARSEAAQRGGHAARRAAILRAIERNSSDPALNAIAIAALLGVTPRYVHLLLEETGRSFTHHVLERRLEKAAALLRDRCRLDSRIIDIAAEAGFADLSHFSRAFRRRYGATPSDIRHTARRELAAPN